MKKIENRGSWKSQYFWVRHFDFFYFIPMNISQHLQVSKDGSKFCWFSGLQQKSTCAHISVTQCMSVGTVYNGVKIVLKFFWLYWVIKIWNILPTRWHENFRKIRWKKNENAPAEIFDPIIWWALRISVVIWEQNKAECSHAYWWDMLEAITE